MICPKWPVACIDLALKICFHFRSMQYGKYSAAGGAPREPLPSVDPKRLRRRMVREQLEARGISDPAVLGAMSAVPRHLFVQEALRAQAYEDTPLPIGYGQTISQPYIVALMSQLCDFCGSEKVLEIGCGSGYQSAILSKLAREIYSIERIEALAKKAEKILLLDIHEISSFTDYFIICNGTSDRMLQALAETIRDFGKKELGQHIEIEGQSRDGWQLVDLGDVIIHIFSPDQRAYYKLEQLWENGKRLLTLQ